MRVAGLLHASTVSFSSLAILLSVRCAHWICILRRLKVTIVFRRLFIALTYRACRFSSFCLAWLLLRLLLPYSFAPSGSVSRPFSPPLTTASTQVPANSVTCLYDLALLPSEHHLHHGYYSPLLYSSMAAHRVPSNPPLSLPSPARYAAVSGRYGKRQVTSMRSVLPRRSRHFHTLEQPDDL